MDTGIRESIAPHGMFNMIIYFPNSKYKGTYNK